MLGPDKKQEVGASDSLWTSVFLAVFGLSVLAFLVVIEHQDWISLRPASGVAKAMSYASQPSAGVR